MRHDERARYHAGLDMGSLEYLSAFLLLIGESSGLVLVA